MYGEIPVAMGMETDALSTAAIAAAFFVLSLI